jgi:hypothetical protein
MAQVKNNLAPPQDSLAYQLATQPEAVAEAVPGAVPELRWYGPCNMTAPELLKWADRAYPARRRARGFLCDFLKDGPRPSKLIWQTALQMGLSRPTVNRAKRDLEVLTHRAVHGRQATFYWYLKEHKPPLSSDPDIRAFEERLEGVRAQLPERNPLDEPE